MGAILSNKQAIKHPLLGVDYKQWRRLVSENGGVSRRHFLTGLYLCLKSIRNSIEKYTETRQYGDAIQACQLRKDPVFILGHWRSGTTLLENILCQDPQFAYLTVIQSLYPHSFITKGAHYSANFGISKRYMDNVKLTADAPSEEEVALAVLAKGSFWHGYYFPSQMDTQFEKYVLFNGISSSELDAWKADYLTLIKKLTYVNQGKQLILKNPPNTARIEVLLSLFPNAKFVHIHRNPYEVFASRIKQYDSAVVKKALQSITKSEWETKTLKYYRGLMDAHLRQREQIPEKNYLELSFDHLKERPLEVLKSLYETLDIPGFEVASLHFEAYVSSLKNYEQNQYDFDSQLINTVNEQWGDYFKLLGYKKVSRSTEEANG